MGLRKCVDCGRDVSDRAAACPNCGGPMTAAKSVATSERRLASQPPPLPQKAAKQSQLKLILGAVAGALVLTVIAVVVLIVRRSPLEASRPIATAEIKPDAAAVENTPDASPHDAAPPAVTGEGWVTAMTAAIEAACACGTPDCFRNALRDADDVRRTRPELDSAEQQAAAALEKSEAQCRRYAPLLGSWKGSVTSRFWEDPDGEPQVSTAEATVRITWRKKRVGIQVEGGLSWGGDDKPVPLAVVDGKLSYSRDAWTVTVELDGEQLKISEVYDRRTGGNASWVLTRSD